MLYADSQEEDLNLDLESEEDPQEPIIQCRQGHTTSLSLRTEEGGSICLLCLSNLISDPRAPTFHVSYALSQLSHALSDHRFLRSLLSYHPHFLVSPLVRALASFDDDPLAHQLVDIISLLCGADASVTAEFVLRLADSLSSGALVWSRRQLYSLHCFGLLLSCQIKDPWAHVKDKDALASNLVAGLQLPSEDIQGEILFVLYKLSNCESKDSDGEDILRAFCPNVLHLSLDALMKTQRDDVRLNCVALLTVLAQKGFFRNAYGNGISSMGSQEADSIMQTTEDGLVETSLNVLFAEAIKGPLLSSDSQVQINALHLIFHYLSWEDASGERVHILLEENIVDYVFEILRSSECKDPMVTSCLKVLDLFPTTEQAFRQRLIVGFPTLLPVLRYVVEVPFHPVQSHTLKLIWNCLSDSPGIISTSHVQELAAVLTMMLKRNTDGDIGMLPQTFTMACLVFVDLLKFPSSQGASDLTALVQEASKLAIVGCLSISEKGSGQLLYSLYLLKEAYAYSLEEFSTNSCSNIELQTFIVAICRSDLLPWLAVAINEMDEETVLGVLETLNFIMLKDSDVQGTEFAKILLSSSWFSFSFKCLGLFPTEKMKQRVYLMLSSLVDVLLGSKSGQTIRDAALYLPSDPIDLLFLLGQKSALNLDLSHCQWAILLILHISCLFDDRLADEKSILASLEQYIIVNSGDLLSSRTNSLVMMVLVNLYGLHRGLAKMNYQISHSPEAERILFYLINKNEWDLSSAMIHSTSLKWLFQQEKIIEPLSYQLLKFCRKHCASENQIIYLGFQEDNIHNITVKAIAELVASGDNYGAKLLVCLLVQLVEGAEEHDVIAAVNLMAMSIKIFPAASDHLCLHGISKAIQTVYYHSSHSSLQLNAAISLLLFNILSSTQHETLSEDESWLGVTMKLMDYLTSAESELGWNHEGLLVIGILSLLLHHSTSKALVEASKCVVLNTSIISKINSTIQAACSKGPALIEYNEETCTGENLIFLLLLYYFCLRCLNVVLPGAVDWQNFLDPSNRMQSVSVMSIYCHDLCRLIHYGSPAVKLVASYCLLESFIGISEQKNTKHEKEKCSTGLLNSIMAVLEGLIFYSDIRVAINCGLSLSLILGWEELDMQETRANATNNWYRIIVEEMAVSLAVPSLASKSSSNHQKPAIIVTAALLKLQKVPEWMRTTFDEPCISGMIENLTVTTVSTDIVLLFRALLNSKLLNVDHVASLNRLFQACRKHLYNSEEHLTDKHGKIFSLSDDLGNVREHLFYLMSSEDRQSGNKRLSEEIEMFFRNLTEEDTNSDD